MQEYQVKDIMVPIEEYATVHKDATLYEAVTALEKAQEDFNRSPYRHRAILILDEHKKLVGKLSQLDVIRALEPKYGEMQTNTGLARYGFTKKFVQSMMEQYKLWDTPLINICQKAVDIKVSAIMTTPSEGEIVDEDASLGQAIHMLVMGPHQSLLVLKKGRITGVLRLTDVFLAIFHTMKECKLS
ncbi:MAG: CBS domain-containing protein [Pseudomonadota bacterium]